MFSLLTALTTVSATSSSNKSEIADWAAVLAVVSLSVKAVASSSAVLVAAASPSIEYSRGIPFVLASLVVETGSITVKPFSIVPLGSWITATASLSLFAANTTAIDPPAFATTFPSVTFT